MHIILVEVRVVLNVCVTAFAIAFEKEARLIRRFRPLQVALEAEAEAGAELLLLRK